MKVVHNIPTWAAAIVGGLYATLAALSTQIHTSEGVHIAIIAVLAGLATMLNPTSGKEEWPTPATPAAAPAAPATPAQS